MVALCTSQSHLWIACDLWYQIITTTAFQMNIPWKTYLSAKILKCCISFMFQNHNFKSYISLNSYKLNAALKRYSVYKHYTLTDKSIPKKSVVFSIWSILESLRCHSQFINSGCFCPKMWWCGCANKPELPRILCGLWFLLENLSLSNSIAYILTSIYRRIGKRENSACLFCIS